MLVYLKLSQRLLNLSLWVFFFLYSFLFLFFWLNVFYLPYVLYHWSDFSASSTPLLFPCKYFFISLSVTFVYAWVFFMLLKYPMSSLSILITCVFNSASDRLSLLCLILFLEFCSVLSFGPYFLVSLFWQPPCVCFYVSELLWNPVLVAWPTVETHTRKLDGAEPQVIARAGQPMWTRLMESQIWCLCSVALCWGGSEKGLWLPPGVWGLFRRKLSPSTHPDARHFSFSLYATGAPQTLAQAQAGAGA